jgi:hypothetical protein
MTTNKIITFIDDPLFSVDFKRFAPQEALTFGSKTQSIAMAAFQFSNDLFESLVQSTALTFSNSGVSFKHIVLGFYKTNWFSFNPPMSFTVIVFRAGFWALSKAYDVVTTTKRLLDQKSSLEKGAAYLRHFSGDEVNPMHIKGKDGAIDMKDVPEEVSVDNLLTIFDAIEWVSYPDYKTKLGEMNRSSLEEGDRDSLKSFINKVKNRIPFLGTPPAGTAALREFYQQIEDAVRFSIHQSNVKLATFHKKYANEPYLPYYQDPKKELPKDWSSEAIKFYNDKKKIYDNALSNILEDRARIAINLAIAEKHCGSRCMGEAMEIYYTSRGESLNANMTLAETMEDLLTQKRLEIARGQIQQHWGGESQSTHYYSEYMAKVGKILGLPGTKSIVEHLSNKLDADHYLNLFFKEYTPNTIIETIQKKVKASQDFREKIFDWVKEQSKTWRKEECEQLSLQAIDKINNLLPSLKELKNDELTGITHINQLNSLVKYVKEKKESLENMIVEITVTTLDGESEQKKVSLAELLKNDWEAGLNELLSLNEAKDWIKKNVDGAETAYRQTVNDLKGDCLTETLGSTLLSSLQSTILKGDELDIESFKERFSIIEKARQIKEEISTKFDDDDNEIKGIDFDDLEILVNAFKNDSFTTTIRYQADRQRQRELLEGLKLHEEIEMLIKKDGKETRKRVTRVEFEGLSKELMEWLLVSQNILSPQLQQSTTQRTVDVGAITENESKRLSYANSLLNLLDNNKLFDLNSYEFKLFLKTAVKGRRDAWSGDDLHIDDAAEMVLKNLKFITESERYRFEKLTNREKLFEILFNHSFVQDPEKAINAAKSIQERNEEFYSRWKHICWIKIPRIAARMIDNDATKALACVIANFIGAFFLVLAYNSTNQFISARALPFFINHAPLKMVQMMSSVSGIRDYVVNKMFNHSHFKLLVQVAMLSSLLPMRIPELRICFHDYFPEGSTVNKIANIITRILMFVPGHPHDGVDFIAKATIFSPFLSSFDSPLCTYLGDFFREMARNNEKDRLKQCRNKAYAIGRAVFFPQK